METIEHFQLIAKQATDLLAKTFNAPDLLPFGKSMLELVERHPEQRAAFAKEFVAALYQPNDFDPWLLEFCMHALRWPELEAKFNAISCEAVVKNDWNLIQPLQHILDSFEDDWEDAQDFYSEYFS